ncbi:MAG: hypothetical protein HZB50_04175 [Chloroflexi bacterium]|nr:hypothetical protein [Chloroflexota bacterium]
MLEKSLRILVLLTLAGGLFLFRNGISPSFALAGGSPSMQDIHDGSTEVSSQAVFTGVVQAVNGDQWTINGQVFTMSPSAIQYGALTVGSPIKVQVNVAPNGLMTITSFGPAELVDASPTSLAEKQIAGKLYFAQGMTPSLPMPNSGGSEYEDYEYYVTGTLTAWDANSITVDGMVYMLTPDSKVKDGVQMGGMVTVKYYVMADGSMIVIRLMPQESWNNDGSNNYSYCSDDDYDDDYDDDEDEDCCQPNSSYNYSCDDENDNDEGDDD